MLAGRASGGASARVDARALAAALRQVRPAADGDPTSPLSTLLIDVSRAGVDVVATNRYWMAIRSLDAGVTGEGRVVLGLADAARLADRLDAHDRVDLELADDRLTVPDQPPVAGRTTPYPAHRLLLDGVEPAITRVVAPVRDLVDTIARTGRAEVTLAITPAGVAVGADEAATREVTASVRGPGLTVRMGSALLQRSLGACLGAEVLLEVAAPDRAVRLSSPYQPGFLALVMPAPR